MGPRAVYGRQSCLHRAAGGQRRPLCLLNCDPEAAILGHRTCYLTVGRIASTRIAIKTRNAKPTTAGKIH
jgi:hypothetical protein